MSPREQLILELVANPASGRVHALVGPRRTFCGRDPGSWTRWGTNVTTLRTVSCRLCRAQLERRELRR